MKPCIVLKVLRTCDLLLLHNKRGWQKGPFKSHDTKPKSPVHMFEAAHLLSIIASHRI